MKHLTKSPEETMKLASKLAVKLNAGDVLLLVGDLGSGKTCFVQGIARGLKIPEGVYVRSPTFTLVNEYLGGRLSLYHIDFYRLGAGGELTDIGLDEYISSDGVTVIEWADKFIDELPLNAKRINFKYVDESKREIELV